MIRTNLNHRGAVLLVEGEDDDKLFGMFLARSSCRTHVAHGKPNLLGALRILDAEGFPGLLAIADTDFSLLNCDTTGSQNLIWTDTHDLETMLLFSPALDKLLHQLGDPQKIGQQDVRSIILELARPLGYARWYSQKQGLSLLFDGLEFDKFITVKSLSLDRSALLNELQSRYGKGALGGLLLWENIEATLSDSHDPWHVCNGHDLVEILSLGLQRVLGSHNNAEVKPVRLEAFLRVAYEKEFFSRTRLWAAIKSWEAVNAPYVILAP